MIADASGNGSNATYDFGRHLSGTPGDGYRLCWGNDPTNISDYNVEIDATAEVYLRRLRGSFLFF